MRSLFYCKDIIIRCRLNVTTDEIIACRELLRHCPYTQFLSGHTYCSTSSHIDRNRRDSSKGLVAGGFALSDFTPNKIRNFSIIAHVDHGKSTLADRLLELLGAIASGSKAQYLDRLQVERERGITVKAQSVSLVWRNALDSQHYLLNLIDTPGHVDFSYEVSRSLAACQGALLLIDAAQGIQAQTLANYHLAREQGLAIVPVLNKIDLPAADPDNVELQIYENFGIEPSDCIRVSAKTGAGIGEIPPALVTRIPPPPGSPTAPMRTLLFDAHHDPFRGVICHIAVVDGKISRGGSIVSAASGQAYDVSEVGIMAPEPHAVDTVHTGQVGYALVGMKDTRSARVGDTWHQLKEKVTPLPGFKPAKSMLFAGVYPLSPSGYEQLAAAMDRLTLNDASVSVKKESSSALGAGFRCGFLGLLHLDVFRQRLEQEHGAEILITTPTVPVKIVVAGTDKEIYLQSPAEFPLNTKVAEVWEPTVLATIVTPSPCVGALIELCQDRRGDMMEHSVLSGSGRVVLKYVLPTAELGGDFYEALKGLSSGYASFDYEEGDMRLAELTRMDILVNGEAVDALARLVHKSKSDAIGRKLCAKLKDLLDRQQFEIALQASAGGRIVARETIKAYRKNVLAKCYGGDISRKRKLLEKQKEGKKKMRRFANVDVPSEAFHQLLRVGNS